MKTLILFFVMLFLMQAMAEENSAVFDCLKQLHADNTALIKKGKIGISIDMGVLTATTKTEQYSVWDQDVFLINDLASKRQPGFYLVTEKDVHFFPFNDESDGDLNLTFRLGEHPPLNVDFIHSERTFVPALPEFENDDSKTDDRLELRSVRSAQAADLPVCAQPPSPHAPAQAQNLGKAVPFAGNRRSNFKRPNRTEQAPSVST